MSKTKEIFAVDANRMANNARDKQFDDYKEQLVGRISKAAHDGEFSLHVNTYSAHGRWAELKQWLESLGFVVGWNANNLMAVIKWDDVSIAEIEMITKPKLATVTYVEKPSRIEFGWNYDTNRYDFVCSCCDEHSEYTSNYCPHCGAKTYVPNGGKRRDY